MNTRTSPINGDLTVNEVIRLYPQTVTVFNEFGIDSCCGGGVAISIAAARDGIDADLLLERLNNAVKAA